MFTMKIENEFLIPFSGLKTGKHTFEFLIDNRFFENYDYSDFNSINATAVVLVNKKSTLLELNIEFKGIANVPCDVTGQDFDMPIEGSLDLIVKFGDSFNNDHDEIVIIPFTEHQIDISHYLYELIVLAIPQKRVHPGIENGTLESEALEYLGYYEETEEEETEQEIEQENNEIDPRWEKLKKLLTDK